jgi:hypothetical protein
MAEWPNGWRSLFADPARHKRGRFRKEPIFEQGSKFDEIFTEASLRLPNQEGVQAWVVTARYYILTTM